MDPRPAIVVLLVVTSVAGASLTDGDVVVTLLVDDAPTDQQTYWHTDVADTQMSLEFIPGRDAVRSSGTWRASLEHRLVSPGQMTPEQNLDTPDQTTSPQRAVNPPSAAPLNVDPSSGDEGASRGSEVTGFTVSLGRYTLVRLPALDRSSAELYCAENGWRVASISGPDKLHQLRDLIAMITEDHDADPRDAFLEVVDSRRQPVQWRADEIKGSACLTMTPSGELIIRSCELQLAFFCERTVEPPAL